MAILDLPFNATSTPLMVTDHHYYPLEVEIANYLANEWSVPVLLGIFAAVCASIVIGTVVIIDKTHPNLPKGEKAAIWWFVICEYLPSIPQFSILGVIADRGGRAWVSLVVLLESGAGETLNGANSNPLAQLEQSTSFSRATSP
jgi:hypothetical protein